MPNVSIDPRAAEFLRAALAFARAIHEGDGDGAVLLYKQINHPEKLCAALGDLLGTHVRDLAWMSGQPENDVWTQIGKYIEHPVEDWVRKRNLPFNNL